MKPVIFIEKKLKDFVKLTIKKDCYFFKDFVDIKNHFTDDYEENLNEQIFPILIFITAENYIGLKKNIDYKSSKNYYFSFILFENRSKYNLDVIENEKDILSIYFNKLNKVESKIVLKNALKNLTNNLDNCIRKNNLKLLLKDMTQDQEDLINIGRNLTFERNTDKLLRLILMMSKKITGADAGSIYIIEEKDNNSKQIRFKFSHTFSKNIPLEEFVISYDKNSIAGYTACTGKVLNIPDVYKLNKNDPISFNNKFDKKNKYRSKSMLVVPMINHQDEIIGVIQLINSKVNNGIQTGNEAFEVKLETALDFKNKVVPFDKRYENLMESVAGQAAIAIENSRMIKQIQTQFEEFVKASVTAIESRDPATSGHSFRVARMCKEVALLINSKDKGVFKDTFFSDSKLQELEYAALLHDFGKVYIELSIFKKSKKLFQKDFENLLLKIDYLYKTIEVDNYIKTTHAILSNPDNKSNEIIAKLEKEKQEDLSRLKDVKEKIKLLNEPSVTNIDPQETLNFILNTIKDIHCFSIEGKEIEIITDKEKENLSIIRGSLNLEERKEIENHVNYTFDFVSKIPWPPEFKNIPFIALKHHEKIDGTGYPSGEKGEDKIPIQSQIMSIADIYDALTATDRPYKKAIPHELALKILDEQAAHNKINRDLLEVFKECNFKNLKDES